ncbi:MULTISPECIES: hypothetical protein [Wolbachia]|uniref:hypothetical protein n=1 Tax=Wolbachia TaxID=953 RepID=UPI0001988C43|nr:MULTISPECIES: hypothetical protein [Wolbachia]EEH12244.1 hypothetical protein WUni_004040 [Wolbachia endosymbiont of Muscidifurax uniraptor]ONI56763.1 hypothetical protein N500_0156 [Wolbachia pipientis wUni]ONI57158.1 hypothetical protein N499_1076 [Wolbachia pipientis wVitA]
MIKEILCNWLGVTELHESQKIDAEQFEKVFGALKEWQEAQKIDAKQFEEVFSALKEWQEAQKIDAEQFEKVFSALEDKIGTEQFQAMQEHLNGLQEKVETLAEAVADQEKTLLICTIATAVAVIAITSFVAFCIYQGVKCEREKEKNLSKDTPDAKLNNVDATDGTKKLRNDLKVDKHIAA